MGVIKHNGYTLYKKTYATWQNMKQRCLNSNIAAYKEYGGRGIKVCDRWLEGFSNFLADMGPRPNGYTLERIDVNGDYEPSNCRWATNKEQQNNRRDCVFIEHDGMRLTVAQWADRLGMKEQTIRNRFLRGWPTHRIMSKEIMGKGAKNARAKLNDAQVVMILKLREVGMQINHIAVLFGVGDHAVQKICSGTGWKHITAIRNMGKEG